MPEKSTNSNVISKQNSDFADYLDFNVLRSSSIEYLGNLTGKVWTDYNVHDPGITILEMLCYAVLDLGYRTNLPAIDIFTTDPLNSKPEDNFFTPAEILSCNPLTILDFRKMLVDVEGVKNAWLKVAEDVNIHSHCNRDQFANTTFINNNSDSCKEFINGLYHVYIEQDNSVKINKDTLIENIKSVLQAHRNFCEDFIDISILCNLDIGICADIELDKGAEADEVYRAIVKALTGFFSPAPEFYTLQQLLDKGKSIDDIFAGRPYLLKNSHGFVDTEEFEKIIYKEEIHVSDVYEVLLSVAGVKTVRRLQLKLCNNDQAPDKHVTWNFKVPDNYVPSFSTRCSGFSFSRNGIAQPVDVKKNEFFFSVNLNNNGKIIQPSKYLDLEIPQGVYHNDLADYYSIQNEFPQVYGIGEGGLSAQVSMQRKAQALQLKGYLLFFDQLLANYLTQLKNIRSLFSFSSLSDGGAEQTYFLNQLHSVPDIDKLLQFSSDGNDDDNFNGSVIAIPIDKRSFLSTIESGFFFKKDIEDLLHPYDFRTIGQRDIAVGLMQNDFDGNLGQNPVIIETIDGSYFYYIESSSEKIILAGVRHFKSEEDAKRAIALFPNAGSYNENYVSFFKSQKRSFSFKIELKLPSFLNYVQQITEDEDGYQTRRDGFLNHLLTRFAEQFTDYALLSYNENDVFSSKKTSIREKERFLENYPALSRDRGKGFNYTKLNQSGNSSGFEKKFKASTGINETSGFHLCNFEVNKYEDMYAAKLEIQGFSFLKTDTSFEGLEEANHAVQMMFIALSNPENYSTEYIPYRTAFQLQVKYDNNQYAYYPDFFDNEIKLDRVRENLLQMFRGHRSEKEIYVSKYVYKLQLTDHLGKVIRLSKDSYDSEQDAFGASVANLRRFDDELKWEIIQSEFPLSGKFSINDKKRPDKLIDVEAFKIEINDNIVGKPGRFNYEVLDKKNAFKFIGLNEFENERRARSDCYKLLLLLVKTDNYQVVKENRKYKIYVLSDLQRIAECVSQFKTEIDARNFLEQIVRIVNEHYFLLNTVSIPNQWKFTYQLGFEYNFTLLFESDAEFGSADKSLLAAQRFSDTIKDVKIEIIDDKYSLSANDKDHGSLTCTFSDSAIVQEDNDTKFKQVNDFLNLRKEITAHQLSAEAQPFEGTVEMDEISRTGQFVYRLVDKNNPIAVHPGKLAKDPSSIIKDLFNQANVNYQTLEICLGGDVIEEYVNSKNSANNFLFLIKCHKDFGPVRKDTILFKSSKRYLTAAEAEAAFYENYISILNIALETLNYGLGKFISLEEIDLGDSIVFIPTETKDQLGADETAVALSLSEIVKNYPIRVTSLCSSEFTLRYSNHDCGDLTAPVPGKKADEKNVYYFVKYNPLTKTEDWQSVRFFNTPAEARLQFEFFNTLLAYKGNYYSEINYCNENKIFIREVLAESKQRFQNEEDAWGIKGVENFISTAQSKNAFHGHLEKKGCTYNFYVACVADGISHPCQYDTTEIRDLAIEGLYSSFSNLKSSNLFKIVREGDDEIIYGTNDMPLALMSKRTDNKVQQSDCERIYEVLQAENFLLNQFNEPVNNYQEIVKPYDAEMPLADWKEQMLMLSYYFPIVASRKINSNSLKFCLEIKLPGFNTQDNDLESRKPCGCGDHQSFQNQDDCYISWKSNCCYESCEEAFKAYEQAQALLADYSNYRSYFDCNCNSFGIALRADVDLQAINPQFYKTPDAVCDAILRSQNLINADGLHAIEHLLLRPRCAEDCSCKYVENRGYENFTNCDNFEYIKKEPKQKESSQEHICFTPGYDPFSFIATVYLPAWPQRFRESENKILLENILQREAPAHVLLRIIWLAPQQLCEFETLYENWNIWLSDKKGCNNKYDNCKILEFLFKTVYKPFGENTSCLPCNEDIVINDCFSVERNESDKTIVLDQINSLFNWNNPIPNPVPETESFKENTVFENVSIGLSKSKSRFVNSRLVSYRKTATAILTETNDIPVVSKVNSFLSESNPLVKKTSALLTEIIDIKEGDKGISTTQKKDLIQSLFWFYFDKVIFGGAEISDLKLLISQVEILKNTGFDLNQLYEAWKPEKVIGIQPEADVSAVKKLLLGG